MYMYGQYEAHQGSQHPRGVHRGAKEVKSDIRGPAQALGSRSDVRCKALRICKFDDNGL